MADLARLHFAEKKPDYLALGKVSANLAAYATSDVIRNALREAAQDFASRADKERKQHAR